MVSASQKNAALVRRYLTDVVAGGDTDALGIFLTDDAMDYQPVLAERMDSKTEPSTYWCILAAADIDIAIDAVVAANDQVAVRGTITGTHCESLLDLVPTGRSFEIACAWFCRIKEDQIKEIWSLPDGLSLHQQLDATRDETPNRSSPHPTEHYQL